MLKMMIDNLQDNHEFIKKFNFFIKDFEYGTLDEIKIRTTDLYTPLAYLVQNTNNFLLVQIMLSVNSDPNYITPKGYNVFTLSTPEIKEELKRYCRNMKIYLDTRPRQEVVNEKLVKYATS
jgi:hypothetical protein